MMAWQKEQMKKAMGGLNSVAVQVHKAYPDTTTETIRRWRLVCTYDNTLVWFYTYNQELAVEGTHDVQIYQDNTAAMRRCIRKYKENE